MYCKVCGEELKPNAKFCGNCGAKVVKEAEAGSKGDIKNCAEPINKKVEIEETKTSKKKTIAGAVASLAIVAMIFVGANDTPKETSQEAGKQVTVNKQVTTAIPKEHREFLAKIGLQVPADDKIDFTDEKGKLHYYRIPSQDGEQGVTMVLVNDNGAINEVNVSHKSKTCYGSFKLVANGNVLGTFSDKLAEHKLEDAQAEQEAQAREAQKAAEAAEQEADARRFANYLGCTVEEYKEHFGPMLSTGFKRGRLDTWYNDSSSTSVNEYGHGVQYVLHLVGRGQNGKRVYVSVYEYSDRPGDYQVQVMNTNHE